VGAAAVTLKPTTSTPQAEAICAQCFARRAIRQTLEPHPRSNRARLVIRREQASAVG
jgi:hypothetical protein